MDVQLVLPDDFTLVGVEDLDDNLSLAKKAIEIIARYCELTDDEFIHVLHAHPQTIMHQGMGNGSKELNHNLSLAKSAIGTVARSYQLTSSEFIYVLHTCAQDVKHQGWSP